MVKENPVFNHWAAVNATTNYLGTIVARAGLDWWTLLPDDQRNAMRAAVAVWASRMRKRVLRFDELPGEEQAAIDAGVDKFIRETWHRLDFSTGRMSIRTR